MSTQTLALRKRAQSTVSLRKRIVRNASEDPKSQMKKSSTMTSFRPRLERLIQEGKIQHLMNQDPSAKAQLCYTNHVSDMEKELASVKKSLSSFVAKSRAKESSINQIKNSIRKVERQMEMIRAEASQTSSRHGSKNDSLENIKKEHENLYWEEKVFVNLKDRGYKDQVFLKGRCEALQRVHDIEVANKRLLEDKFHELKQLNKELKGYKRKAERIAKAQTVDKNEYIALLEQDMSERELMEELRADKYKREGEINEIAPSLIEREELERILEVLYAHRILSQIIKNKSNNLIKKYESVNKAYNHIKSNSNIPEPDKILKRMQQHDKLYDDALKRVNALEAQLVNIEKGFENVALSKNQILSQEGYNETLPANYYQGLERDKYELLLSEKEKQEERNTADEVLRLNILEWGKRMFARYGITQNESNNFLDCLTDLVVKIRQQK